MKKYKKAVWQTTHIHPGYITQTSLLKFLSDELKFLVYAFVPTVYITNVSLPHDSWRSRDAQIIHLKKTLLGFEVITGFSYNKTFFYFVFSGRGIIPEPVSLSFPQKRLIVTTETGSQ